MIFGTSHRGHWNSRQFSSCLSFGILDFVHQLAQKGIEDTGIPYFFHVDLWNFRHFVPIILRIFRQF